MGLLQSDKVVFYHPCDDSTEFTQTADWAEAAALYPAGKVSNGLAGTAGDAPAYGAENEFDTGIIGYTATVALGSGRVLVGWPKSDETEIRYRVGTVSGSDITFGPQYSFSGSNLTTQGGRWALLDSTHVVAAYRAASVAYARVLTISGSDVTAGPASSPAGNVQFPLAVPLGSSAFVFVYRDSGDSSHGTAKVGTVSGTDITFGAEHEFFSGGEATELDACALSSTKVVVTYSDGTSSFHGTAKVGTVSGTDITFGAAKAFASAGQADSRCCALDSAHFAVLYGDGGNGWRCGTRVGAVSGTDITFGAEAVVTSNGVSKPYAIPLGSSQYVAVYRDNTDSGHGTTKLVTVSGTDATVGSEVEYLSANGSTNESGAAVSSSKFVVAYRDGADSNKGTARVGGMAAAGSLAHQSGTSYGTAGEFLSAGTASGYSCDALDSTRFIVIWSANTAGKGQAVIATVSGTAVTFGAVAEFWSSQPSGDSLGVAALGSAAAVVVWKKGTGQGVGVAATVSGDSVTFGAEAQFVASCGTPRVAALDSATCVVVYEDNGASRTRARVGTVSGSDLTWDAVSGDLVAAQAGSPAIAALSSTAFVVSYTDVSDSSHGYCKVGTVSGGAVTWGAGAKFLAASPTYMPLRLAAMSATKFAVAWTSGSSGRARVGSVSGSAITYGAEATFLSGADAGDISMAAAGPSTVVVAYRDDGDGQSGQTALGTVSGTAISFAAAAEFQSAVSRLDVAYLGSGKFAVIYGNGDDSYNGYAVAGEFSATSYPSVVSETRVAFCGWFKKPS